jgi:hypothetical protein
VVTEATTEDAEARPQSSLQDGTDRLRASVRPVVNACPPNAGAAVISAAAVLNRIEAFTSCASGHGAAQKAVELGAAAAHLLDQRVLNCIRGEGGGHGDSEQAAVIDEQLHTIVQKPRATFTLITALRRGIQPAVRRW